MRSIAADLPDGPDQILQASVFGSFVLATDDGTEILISNRRARAIVAMLCLAPSEALERDFVSKLLWPGRSKQQARASLRQCLWSLDRAMAPLAAGLLEMSHGRIAIRPSSIRTDLADLEAALSDTRTEDACILLARIANRPLLDQMNFGEAFTDWLGTQRHRIENSLEGRVDRALERLDQRADVSGRSRLDDAWRACGRASALKPQP